MAAVYHNLSPYGQIHQIARAQKIADSEPAQTFREMGCPVSIYCWEPNRVIRSDVPQEWNLKFLFIQGADGIRRFLTVQGHVNLIEYAYAGGLAIMSHFKRMRSETNGYNRHWQLFRKVQHLQQHNSRKFGGNLDLKIPKYLQEEFSQKSVLPAWIGGTADGEGKPWNFLELKRQGKRLAISKGQPEPDAKKQLEYGIYAGVRNYLNGESGNSLETDQPSSNLVRQALYSSGSEEEPSEDKRQWIEERIWEALDKHFEDNLQKYDQWLLGPGNTFAKQISRKTCPYGAVTPSQVQNVLLDLGWKSYELVSQCVDFQMKAFVASLELPLTQQVLKLFQAMYFQQHYFENIPLCMMIEVLPLLRPAICDYWQEESINFENVVGLLLKTYAIMISTRQDVDRRVKQRKATVKGVKVKEESKNLKAHTYRDVEFLAEDKSEINNRLIKARERQLGRKLKPNEKNQIEKHLMTKELS
ncbi:hypothetical protein [uncultured Rubinisphaera sp.]|uniref:hypothetical protein n=1 Tax=uncultured Rubinisphaera sp. TaxID=1678686 RepID=UPI0030D9339A